MLWLKVIAVFIGYLMIGVVVSAIVMDQDDIDDLSQDGAIIAMATFWPIVLLAILVGSFGTFITFIVRRMYWTIHRKRRKEK